MAKLASFFLAAVFIAIAQNHCDARVLSSASRSGSGRSSILDAVPGAQRGLLDSHEINVFVQEVGADGFISGFDLLYSPNTSIAFLKLQVDTFFNVSAERQVLKYSGTTLCNNKKTLAQYHLKDKAVVTLTRKG